MVLPRLVICLVLLAAVWGYYEHAIDSKVQEIPVSDGSEDCISLFQRGRSLGVQRNTHVTTNVTLDQPSAPRSAGVLDVVLVAHHDDAPIMLGYALPSMFRSIQGIRNVYIVGTPQLVSLFDDVKNRADLRFPIQRVFVVNQEEYPFSLKGVAANRSAAGFHQEPNDKDRNAWTYQQLLKLYVHEVLGKRTQERPPLLPNVLVADSDVIWLKPTEFVYKQEDDHDVCWYSVASNETGSFQNDADDGQMGNEFLLPLFLQEAVPEKNQRSFTAITHHSMFQADVAKALLDTITSVHGRPAWEALAITQPFLSEYDLYLSWAVSRFPERVALRSLPYMNSGRDELLHVDPEDFAAEKEKPSVPGSRTSVLQVPHPGNQLAYAAFHDDYPSDAHCCVNLLESDFKFESGDRCGACSNSNLDLQSKASATLRACQGEIYPSQPVDLVSSTGELDHASQGAELLKAFAACVHDEH